MSDKDFITLSEVVLVILVVIGIMYGLDPDPRR